MRKYLILICLLFFTLHNYAQKYFITNQYVYDLFLINPADAGNKDCTTFNGFFQKQWFGVDLAPTTQLLSFQTPFPNNLGTGTYIFNDRNGNFKRMGLQQSFSAKVVLRENSKGLTTLHFGISALFEQSSIDYSNFGPDASLDPIISGVSESGTGFNSNSGLMLEINNYHVGVAASNILSQNNPMYKSEWEPDQGLDIHVHAGTSWKITDRDLYFEPLVYYRRNKMNDSRFDANMKIYMPTMDPSLALWSIVAYRRTMDHRIGEDLGLGTTIGVDFNSFSFGIEHQLGMTAAQKQFGSAFVVVAGYRICRDPYKNAFPCTQKDAIIKAARRDPKRGLKGIKDASGR